MDKNYIVFHLHSDLSNSITIDSTTKYQEYIDLAVKNDMKAIAFSEHGGVFEWIKKKQSCDKAGIKYIHGQEFYLTTTLDEKLRETFHVGLYARNNDGVKELNQLSSIAFNKEDNHYYYKPRISLDELKNTSDNIIITTACLASILWKKKDDEKFIDSYLSWASKNKHRFFLEIQYHNDNEQKEYNQLLYKWSQQYDLKLIAGTDTHSSTPYKAETRKILQQAKNMFYGNEDLYDLTFKSYDELVEMFRIQNALPEQVYLQAIDNTNLLNELTEEIKLDYSFKYPKLYKDEDAAFLSLIREKYTEKINRKIINDNNGRNKERLNEEFVAFKKIGMSSFMTFMSELTTWCWDNDIPIGYNRGSVGGSSTAYILDIIDLDPLVWNTVFSRFVNEDRVSLGDIDLDFDPEDREKVYEYIINRFPKNNTAFIITFNTVADKGTIDEIGRALNIPLDDVKQIKELYDTNPEQARNKYPNVFYYFDGLKDTIISMGIHPAGIIASPVDLHTEIGILYGDNKVISQCGMKAIDSVNFTKFDILGLKNIGIIKKTFEYLNKPYMKSHEIDWEDENVWDDMITSPVGLFQFEGDYAFNMLKQFKPRAINDMSIVNAALRPSGASYRDSLMRKEFHKNPSEQIDELLKDNMGYLIFQEDTIKFLTDICGFTGAEADNVRRAIGKKDLKALNLALPKILDGYCSVSDKPREIAEQEAKEFLQIIEDSSEYQFGFNHSTGYSMIGYTCAMLRYYHPLEFTTAYLNTAANEDDVKDGTNLARLKGIEILPPKFRFSMGGYVHHSDKNAIYKGVQSIKNLNSKVAEELYTLKDNQYDTFMDLLLDISNNTSANKTHMETLIKLNFFDEFGGNKLLLQLYEEFRDGKLKYDKKHKEKTILERIEKRREFEQNLRQTLADKEQILSVHEQVLFEKDALGYVQSTYPQLEDNFVSVLDIDTKHSPKIYVVQLNNGMEYMYKMPKKDYYHNGKSVFYKGDILKVNLEDRQKGRYVDDKWIPTEETEQWIKSCTVYRNKQN